MDWAVLCRCQWCLDTIDAIILDNEEINMKEVRGLHGLLLHNRRKGAILTTYFAKWRML